QEAQTAAKAELPEIEPRIAMITVSVAGAEGRTASVTLDGQTIPPAFVGAPKPVDPGEHKLQATTEGMASDVVTVRLKDGARETVSVTVRRGKGAPIASLPAAAPPSAAPSSTGPASAPEAATRVETADVSTSSGGSNGMRVASYAALGMGVVGLGVG